MILIAFTTFSVTQEQLLSALNIQSGIALHPPVVSEGKVIAYRFSCVVLLPFQVILLRNNP